MQKILVRRYRTGFADDGTPHIGSTWQGTIAAEDGSFTIFVDINGRPLVFLADDLAPPPSAP